MTFGNYDDAIRAATVLILNCRWFEMDPLPDGDRYRLTFKDEPLHPGLEVMLQMMEER